MSESFITGSYAYGVPTESSDIDLVVRCDEATKKTLHMISGGNDQHIRFGKLQLIAFTDDEDFDRWRSVTEELIKRRPVSRKEAVAAFKKRLREDLDY